ncbi:MAG: tail tape measure protein, partial [Alteraurantiacibacter sp.]
MDDEIETLMVEVRANTDSFRSEMQSLRGTLDTTLLDGFAKAGNVLERGLVSALRRGKLGFEELKTVALTALHEIAAQALQSGLGALFGSKQGGGGGGFDIGSVFSGFMGSLLGLPGRATG